ncbi:MAG: GNAT family N-acetyltransferase [Bacteroidetes bacterium]|nr:GNAT family N-acetyltransferase [Bacteroidota bacterium]
MIIRNAVIQDLPFVVSIYNQSILKGGVTGDLTPFTADQKESWFQNLKANNYPFLVMEHNNEVIGYAYLAPYRPGKRAFLKSAEITYYVEEKHLHKGIGSKLVDSLLDQASKMGFKTIIAILMHTNQASVQFLTKKEFEQWAYLPDVGEYKGETIHHLYFGKNILG